MGLLLLFFWGFALPAKVLGSTGTPRFFLGLLNNNNKEDYYMLDKIIEIHKDALFKSMDYFNIDEYGLAWFCFIKGILFTLILQWIF